MLKMLKTKNPDTDYPTNMGQKWTDEEEAAAAKLNTQNPDETS